MEDMHNKDCIDQPNVWDWDTWNQTHLWLVQPMNTMTFFMVLYNFIFQCQKISLTKINTLWLSIFLFKNTLKYNFVLVMVILSSLNWNLAYGYGHHEMLGCFISYAHSKLSILRTLHHFERSDDFAKMTLFEWTCDTSIIKPLTELWKL